MHIFAPSHGNIPAYECAKWQRDLPNPHAAHVATCAVYVPRRIIDVLLSLVSTGNTVTQPTVNTCNALIKIQLTFLPSHDKSHENVFPIQARRPEAFLSKRQSITWSESLPIL